MLGRKKYIVAIVIAVIALTSVTIAFSKSKYQTAGETVKNLEAKPSNIIAMVNGEAITDIDIEINLAYNKMLGDKPKSKNDILQEKIKFMVVAQEAKAQNLIPTDEEVSKFLLNMRKEMAKSEKVRKQSTELYSGLGLTEDQYYKNYFEVYRSQLTYGNLMHKIMDDIKGDESKKMEAFQKYIDNLLSKAKVEILNQEYLNS